MDLVVCNQIETYTLTSTSSRGDSVPDIVICTPEIAHNLRMKILEDINLSDHPCMQLEYNSQLKLTTKQTQTKKRWILDSKRYPDFAKLTKELTTQHLKHSVLSPAICETIIIKAGNETFKSKNPVPPRETPYW